MSYPVGKMAEELQRNIKEVCVKKVTIWKKLINDGEPPKPCNWEKTINSDEDDRQTKRKTKWIVGYADLPQALTQRNEIEMRASVTSVTIEDDNKTAVKMTTKQVDVRQAIVADREELDARTMVDTTDTTDGRSQKPRSPFQARRAISLGLYDMALMMANVSQLKTILDLKTHKYYTLVVTLLGISISVHLIGALLLYIVLVIEKNEKNRREHLEQLYASDTTHRCDNCWGTRTECKCWKIQKLDCVATVCIFIVTVVNIFIIAFLGGVTTDNVSVDVTTDKESVAG